MPLYKLILAVPHIYNTCANMQTQGPHSSHSKILAMNLIWQCKNPVVKEGRFKLGFWQTEQIKVSCLHGETILLIFMEKTLLFLCVVFGDFRNQVQHLSPWTVPLLDRNGFFFFSFSQFHISKSFTYHKLIRLQMEKQKHTRWNKKTQRTNRKPKINPQVWSWEFYMH